MSMLVYSQKVTQTIPNLKQTLGKEKCFIENIGQYGNKVVGFENMDSIFFAYEGLGMPVLFTKKGLIHLQRKVENISKTEEEKLERQGLNEEEIEQKKIITDRIITMEWLGANKNVVIEKEEKTNAYHTYGFITSKAFGYKKIIYKNLYNGIDVIYKFTDNVKLGFEYAILIKPGADVGLIKMKYGGDVKSVYKNINGDVVIKSDINGIEESAPISFYNENNAVAKKSIINSKFTIEKNQVSFNLLQPYDNTTKEIIIDPYVSNTLNLTGANAGKAKDIDFDYEGNIYVTGGGSSAAGKLAKYDAAGIVQWTFNGSLATPIWTYGQNYGGAIVEKSTGNIYLSQGLPSGGFRVIRLNTTGVYDNYISLANPTFGENWKMYWNCNNGTPEILVAGGGGNSNINLGRFSPPSTTITALNITGRPNSHQDVVDFIFDLENNDMYSAFASIDVASAVSNKIFKNPVPYGSTNIAWEKPTGFATLVEPFNRPYLNSLENSANILAINASFLYFWDGKNLKAFDKATGNIAGINLVTQNTAKMQGGIFADACNNIFVGDINGTIKVYNFNGNVFNDAPVDIIIPGFQSKSIYDIVYDEPRRLLYVAGDGFVASVNISSYCTVNNTFFNLNLLPNCNTASVTANITPAVPAGSTVMYTLYTGITQISSNLTGIFTGLASATNYQIIATINAACSGTQISNNFILPAPIISTTITSEICGNNGSQIIVVGSGSTAPYTYSIDGINFSTNGTFPGLVTGAYTITVRDANNCTKSQVVNIINTNSLVVTFTLSYTNTTCGNNTGTINASTKGGTQPYQFSIDNGVTYQLSNIFSGLSAGNFQLNVKDANGCISNILPIQIAPSTAVIVSGVPTNSTCSLPNGVITANSGGGTLPYQFSINGGATYQTSNIFTGLAAGNYTINIKDINNCTGLSPSIILSNTSGPVLSATAINATCGFKNGSITAKNMGGTPPFLYSLNAGVTFQPSATFNNLVPTNYIVQIKDNNNCESTYSITVANTAIPILKVFAGNDTTIAFKEPLQLNAIDVDNIGFFSYTWSSSLGLNNANIKAPIAILEKDISYTLLAKTIDGCIAKDTIKIKVVLKSDIYIPTAFTPNADGSNDIFKPKLVGIKELKYFCVYNRYGELIYKTSEKNTGWNGLINGIPQNTGTFVWMIEALDYNGNILFRKGTTILLK